MFIGFISDQTEPLRPAAALLWDTSPMVV